MNFTISSRTTVLSLLMINILFKEYLSLSPYENIQFDNIVLQRPWPNLSSRWILFDFTKKIMKLKDPTWIYSNFTKYLVKSSNFWYYDHDLNVSESKRNIVSYQLFRNLGIYQKYFFHEVFAQRAWEGIFVHNFDTVHS